MPGDPRPLLAVRSAGLCGELWLLEAIFLPPPHSFLSHKSILTGIAGGEAHAALLLLSLRRVKLAPGAGIQPVRSWAGLEKSLPIKLWPCEALAAGQLPGR